MRYQSRKEKGLGAGDAGATHRIAACKPQYGQRWREMARPGKVDAWSWYIMIESFLKNGLAKKFAIMVGFCQMRK